MFDLRKWYFDCTSSKGEVFIGYAAKIKFGWLKLNYSASLFVNNNKRTQKQSLDFGKIIKRGDGEALEWHNKSLGVKGVWTGSNGLGKINLFTRPDGIIDWQCVKTSAETAITKPDGSILLGSGYVEELHLTVSPWKLPLKELRWGRFISDNMKEFVIWVDWGGKERRCNVWSDKGSFEGAVTDESISFGDKILFLKPFALIRHEHVSRSILGNFDWLIRFFPRNMRYMDETKQLSRGSIGSHEGWSINENVTWK